IAFAFGGFAVFALHDALVKSLVGYSVFQIVFFAVLFGYVPFSVSLVADKRQANLRPVNPLWVLLRTACMVGSTAFAFFAFRTLELAQTYAILFASPVLITVLAIPLLGERVRLFRCLAIALGSAGVLIALRPTAGEFGIGHVAALLAVTCSATSAVVTRRIAASERSATLILFPLLANVVVSGVILGFVYKPMPFADVARLALIGSLAMAG
ncbi:MAG: EamA family transporter, partial [Candidatus Competibacteraceae bacterium]|nr:EamA family transporter [Candidatus Competibacteraceae bacterium]